MKKLNAALLTGLIFSLIISGFMNFSKSYNHLQNNVVRLHIIANSDSIQDQKLKLLVRDAILEHSNEFFGSCIDKTEAEENINNNLEKIESTARHTIIENGFSYNVKAELVNMDFEAKQYDDITMPAGNYDALRITIGNAKGHNWWCVMYPPLCLPVKGVIEEYFSEDEQDILYNPEKYEIRFKCTEIISDIVKKLEKQSE